MYSLQKLFTEHNTSAMQRSPMQSWSAITHSLMMMSKMTVVSVVKNQSSMPLVDSIACTYTCNVFIGSTKHTSVSCD